MIQHIERHKVLPEVLIVQPELFEDYRGYFLELYNRQEYSEAFSRFGYDIDFVQDDVSLSTKDVIRGIHGDKVTYKLVQCIRGSVLLGVVDARPESPNYLKHFTLVINEHNRLQVMIPARFGNSYRCLTDQCAFYYKQSSYYQGADQQFTLRLDDPKIGIDWGIELDRAIISKRDREANLVSQ